MRFLFGWLREASNFIQTLNRSANSIFKNKPAFPQGGGDAVTKTSKIHKNTSTIGDELSSFFPGSGSGAPGNAFLCVYLLPG